MAGQLMQRVAKTGNNPFLRVVAAISTFAGWVSAAMIVVAVGITCQMIFVRAVLNHSTIWQTEMVVYLVVGATLIGLPYVQRLRGHVNVDLVPIALPSRARFVMACFTLSLSIAVVAVMFWYGFDYWHYAWDRGWRSESIWGVRLWIPYMALPVGFGLLLLQLIADMIGLILRIEAPFGLENT